MSKENNKNEEISQTTPTETSSQEGKVGTMLRDVRIKKKISIEEVAKDLYIKASYLNAIENSDYDNIPAHPYGLGFVRSYANYLGLNSSRIVQIFKEETASDNTSNYQVFSPEENTQPDQQNNKYLFISLGMILIGYLIWVSFSNQEASSPTSTETLATENKDVDYPLQVDNFATSAEENTTTETQQINVTDEVFSETQQTTSPDEPSAETNNAKEAPDNKEQTTKVASQQTSAEQKTGRVVLKIKKETWIEVRDSHQEKLWISKVLNSGDEYIVPENGTNKIVSFGNTDGVDVIIDGKIVTIVSKNKKTNIKLDAFLTNH